MSDVEQVWLQYKSALRAFLFSKVANTADAEDLLQEILIKTYQNLASVKDSKKVKSWLFQVARNTLIDYYRKKGKAKEVDTEFPNFEAEGPDILFELSACVLPFIDALPEKQRNMLKAIEIEGMSQKAYAQQQGIKYSTLKSQVKKAREALFAVYSDCCHLRLDKQGNLMEYSAKSEGCNKC